MENICINIYMVDDEGFVSSLQEAQLLKEKRIISQPFGIFDDSP
jgi:hypothetical protein